MTKRVRQLDGIRGLAILIVMLHNQVPKYPSLHLERVFASGWMGVDLFFVLSGLLITGILLETKGSEGYFGRFYARRCLRIWPLYYAILVFMFVLVPMLRPSEGAAVFAPRSSPWWSYPIFLQNFLVPAPTRATGPLGVTWSLAIEEQFYLVWPLAVAWFSTRHLRRLAIVAIGLSPFIRWYFISKGIDPYPNLFCRMDGLMLGALLAVTIRSETFEPTRFVPTAWLTLSIALPLALVADTLNVGSLVYSLAAVASAALVYLALFASQSWLQRILTNRFIVYTGVISYGLYLLHKIPFDLAQAIGLDRYPLAVLPLGFASSYLAAFVSWNFLEQPVLRLKRYFEPRRGLPPPLKLRTQP